MAKYFPNGVAMGTKMGPSYANVFVGYVEHQFFNQYDGPKPDFYGRYNDDCIGAISSSREELNRFITSVNSFHPSLKYTWEISETSLAFLDIKVSRIHLFEFTNISDHSRLINSNLL